MMEGASPPASDAAPWLAFIRCGDTKGVLMMEGVSGPASDAAAKCTHLFIHGGAGTSSSAALAAAATTLSSFGVVGGGMLDILTLSPNSEGG